MKDVFHSRESLFQGTFFFLHLFSSAFFLCALVLHSAAARHHLVRWSRQWD